MSANGIHEKCLFLPRPKFITSEGKYLAIRVPWSGKIPGIPRRHGFKPLIIYNKK